MQNAAVPAFVSIPAGGCSVCGVVPSTRGQIAGLADCDGCGTPGTAQVLARGVTEAVGWPGTLSSWVAAAPRTRLLRVGDPTPLDGWLDRLPSTAMVELADQEAGRLAFADATWDLVAHTSWPRVRNLPAAAAEALRVVQPGGSLLIAPRVATAALTEPSEVWHLGTDVWVPLLHAGARDVRIVASEPSVALALIARR